MSRASQFGFLTSLRQSIAGSSFLAANIKRLSTVILGIALALGIILEFGVWTKTQRLAGPYAKSGHGAHSYVIKMPAMSALPALFHVSSSSSSANRRSTLELLENGRKLGPRNSAHSDIGNIGQGRYSHWGEFLFFSSGNNSDPNSNARTYVVSAVIVVRRPVLVLLALLLAFALMYPHIRNDIVKLLQSSWSLRQKHIRHCLQTKALLTVQSLRSPGRRAQVRPPLLRSIFLLSILPFAVAVLAAISSPASTAIPWYLFWSFVFSGLVLSATWAWYQRIALRNARQENRLYVPALPHGLRRAFFRLRPSTRAFWIIIWSLIAFGLAYRFFWSLNLEAPYLMPDSLSYLDAMSMSTWIPVHAFRTPGLPLTMSLALASAGAPIGILLLHNALWALSALAMVFVLKRHYDVRIIAIVFLSYLTFAEKNIAFEFNLMSEHQSRTLYVATAAVMLLIIRRGGTVVWSGVLGSLVLLNIMTKPSALILIPATIILFAGLYFVRRNAAVGWQLGCFLAVVLGGVLSYQLAFNQQYGRMSFSHFDGYNLFSHVGHLVKTDGGAYRELKKELGPLIVKYRKEFADKGRHYPNWLVYGSTDEDLRRVFGDKSPASLVSTFAGKKLGGGIAVTNKVFLDLAVEGILDRPLDYTRHVLRSFYELFKIGFGDQYYKHYLTDQFFQHHSASLAQLRSYVSGTLAPGHKLTCNNQASIELTWPVWALASSEVMGCRRPTYQAPTSSISKFANFFTGVAARVYPTLGSFFFVALPFVAPLLILFIGAANWPRRAQFLAAATGLSALIVLGYGSLLALMNIAEPARFLVNVQDLIILSLLLLIASVLSCEHRYWR